MFIRCCLCAVIYIQGESFNVWKVFQRHFTLLRFNSFLFMTFVVWLATGLPIKKDSFLLFSYKNYWQRLLHNLISLLLLKTLIYPQITIFHCCYTGKGHKIWEFDIWSLAWKSISGLSFISRKKSLNSILLLSAAFDRYLCTTVNEVWNEIWSGR